MATFAGNYSGAFLYSDATTVPNFGGKDTTPNTYLGALEVAGVGSSTSTQPVTEPGNVHVGGWIAEMYGLLHFYDHIHFQYPELNLGNVLGDQAVQFWIFNGFFTPQTLEEITRTGVDDLNIDPTEASMPRVFTPFEQVYFDLSIPAAGPPSVDVHYLFDFGFRTYDLHVFGSRLVLFPFVPQGDIAEQLEFSSAIKGSDDENEQRAKLRNPRQRMTYKVRARDLDSALIQSLMFDWQHRIIGVPFWPEARFGSELEAGVTELEVPTDSGDFRIGGLVYVYQNRETFEAQAIVDMDGSSITTQAPLANDYPRPVIMPIRDCYAANNVPRSMYPVNATDITVAFVSLTNTDLSNIDGAPLYDGRVVLDGFNFMKGTKALDISRTIRVADSKTGTLYQASKAEHGRLRTSKVWEPRARADVWRVRRMLHYLTTRRSCWLSTGAHDFQLLQTIAPNGDTLRVANTYYTTFVRNRRPLGDIRIRLTNGDEFYRRIIDSNADAGDEVLAISAPISASAIEVDEVHSIDFLLLVRLEGNAELLHSNSGRATISANVVSVKA